MEYSSVHEGWQNRSVELIRLVVKQEATQTTDVSDTAHLRTESVVLVKEPFSELTFFLGDKDFKL